MKLRKDKTTEARTEFCESCAIICSPTCIAKGERDRVFQNLLRYGPRPL